MPGVPDDDWGLLRAELAVDVRRVSDRLRSLSHARLREPVPPFPSRAAAGLEAARVLAVAAHGIEERAGADEPSWRQLPELADFAVGDQVAVTGQDLLAALEGLDPAETVWASATRRPARNVVAEAAAALAATRRLL